MADPATCPPLSPVAVAATHDRIARYIYRTPLLSSELLNEISSSPSPEKYLSSEQYRVSNKDGGMDEHFVPSFNLYFKAESMQRMGAFKVRGAFSALENLLETIGLDDLKHRGVVTHSSGNHAQALAYASYTHGVPSYIVVPRNTTPSKVTGARRYATEIIFAEGSTIEDREETMRGVQARTNAIFVPPFDHVDIVLGQGTVGKEMEEQLQEDSSTNLDAVLAPLGGGGLLAGIAIWFADKPNTKVFGAEPSFQGADDGKRGREQGNRINSVKSLTIADGLRMPVGHVNWKVVSQASKVQGIYSATEEEIKMAMKLIFEHLKVVVEPSACVPLAVILFNQEFRMMAAEMQVQEGKSCWNLGIVLSGGNTTMEKISFMFRNEAGEKLSSLYL